mgnify:CR=1 FL=1
MAVSQIASNKNLSRMVGYVRGNDKQRVVAEQGYLTSTDRPDEEMMDIIKRHKKRTGLVQCYSTKISFSDQELNPNDPFHQQMALNVCYDVASRAFPDNQSYIGIHNDGKGGKLHGHIITNATKVATGKQLAGRETSWKRTLAPVVDECCREYGLSTIEKTRYGLHPYHDDKAQIFPDEVLSNEEPYMKVRSQADQIDYKTMSWKEYLKDAVYNSMTNPDVTSLQAFEENLEDQYQVYAEKGKRGYRFSTVWETRGQRKNKSLSARKLANKLEPDELANLKTTGEQKLGRLFSEENIKAKIEENSLEQLELDDELFNIDFGTKTGEQNEQGEQDERQSENSQSILQESSDTVNYTSQLVRDDEERQREKKERERQKAQRLARRRAERAKTAEPQRESVPEPIERPIKRIRDNSPKPSTNHQQPDQTDRDLDLDL